MVLAFAGTANAATQIVWRSASTGAIQSAAPTTPTTPTTPTVPDSYPLAVNYGPNDRTEVRGQAVSITPAILNGTKPYLFSITGGALPSGYALDASTGRIVGIAPIGGTYTATVRVVDGAGKVLQFSLAFQIN